MKIKYKNTIFHFLATFGYLISIAPLTHADTQTPLDCPGVIVVQGGYSLTKDTTCDTGFHWNENNKFFSLNGFTLTTGSIFVDGDHLTIRNGALQTNSIFWAGNYGTLRNGALQTNSIFWAGNYGTLLNLAITSAGEPRGFFIEAGSNFTVRNSTFTNIPNVALDFYFGSGGTVRNSKFTGNGRAISIQRSNDVLIEHNNFVGNIRGINLWDEDGAGVNNNKIRHNIFRENGVGINILALPQSTRTPAFEGNQIIGNQISRSSHSGILIEVVCDNSSVPLRCPAQNTNVGSNLLNRNGFGLLTDLADGVEPGDDGVTARAVLRVSRGSDNSPFPEGLAGVTLSNNRANRNADLGFDVQGVTDGGGNIAKSNGNPEQCVGLVCDISVGEPLTILPDSISARSLTVLQDAKSKAPLASDQLRHKH